MSVSHDRIASRATGAPYPAARRIDRARPDGGGSHPEPSIVEPSMRRPVPVLLLAAAVLALVGSAGAQAVVVGNPEFSVSPFTSTRSR